MPWAFLLGLGLFLAAGAGALGIAGALARRHPAERGALEIAALAGAGIFGVLFLFQNVLAHDALWYYSHLRSAIVDGDLDLYDELVLHNPHAMTLPAPGARIAPLGAPILAAPAVLAVRPFAALLAHKGVAPGWDGYEPLETAAVTWTALLAALGGVALTHRFARTVAGGPAATVAVVALLYASPAAFLTFVWPGHPEAATMLAGAAFLCVWKRDDTAGSPSRALLLGLLGGVLALVDPRHAVYLALPVVDAILGGRRSSARSLALLAAGAIVGFSPQGVAWLTMHAGGLVELRHEWAAWSTLLAWAPLYAAGVAGIVLLRRTQPRWCRGLLLLVALEGVVSHGLLGAWPALAIGLAVAIDRLASRVGFFAASLATTPFVYWNLLLIAQIRLGWIAQDRPLDVGAALALQLHEAPAAMVRGLCAGIGWNQVMLIEQLRAAVEIGSLRGALAWLAALAVAAGVLALWMKVLATDAPASPSTGARSALALGAACLLAACGVASVAHGHGRTRLLADVRATPFLAPPGALQALSFDSAGRSESIAWRADAAGGERGRLRLDLVSFLRHAEHLEDGALAALIDLHGPGCPAASLAVRAGFETAETAPERAERQGVMRHGLTHTTVVQSWWDNDLTDGHSVRHAYLASWRIAPGCRPDTVQLRVDPHGADLEIRSLSVAVEPGGGGFAPKK